jgi:hypothetical protein
MYQRQGQKIGVANAHFKDKQVHQELAVHLQGD